MPCECWLVVRYSSLAQWPNSVWTVVKTCSDVGGRKGRRRPSALDVGLFEYSSSWRTVSSDEEVIEDDSESAGVEVGEAIEPFERARASACDKAERYDAADAGTALADRFLNIEVDFWGLFNAIGDGRGELKGIIDFVDDSDTERCLSASDLVFDSEVMIFQV